MSSLHFNKKTVFFSGIILGAFVFLCPLRPASSEDREQVMTFSVCSTIAALRLGSAEPLLQIVSTAPRFSLNHVHLLGKIVSRNSRMPKLEPVETYGSLFGLKITLQLKGGWNVFSGGDIENGIGGMYDNAVHMISVTGVPITQNQKESNHAGLEASGDLIYCITPRFGIGIGASRIKAGKESVLIYEVMSPQYESLRTRPEIKVTALRLGLFYAFPFADWLAISVHGGPALYSAKYIYNMAITSGSYSLDVVWRGYLPTGLYQEARAKQVGLEGGVGFEFNVNPFVALFVEALGRYARIGGFEGEKKTSTYINFRPQVLTQAGSLYFMPSDKYPLLNIIPPEGSVAETARKATLDFSGFSFSAGLKLRF